LSARYLFSKLANPNLTPKVPTAAGKVPAATSNANVDLTNVVEVEHVDVPAVEVVLDAL
jgi:hypothetical protein